MSIDFSGTTQFLIFKVAEHSCAVSLSDVREVVLMAALTPPLAQSEVVEGLLNLGGEVIPVLKLNRILGLIDWTPGLYSHIILAKSADQTLGFLTQSAYKIASFTRDALSVLPNESSWNSCATALIRENKDFIHVLSFPRIIKRFDEALVSSNKDGISILKAAV